MVTVSDLKDHCLNRPFIARGTPSLCFCAIVEMDFDGPDYAGPPISDIVKTYFNGKPALVLVYSLKNGGEDKTGIDALNAITRFGLTDEAIVLLLDQDSGETSEVTSIYSCFHLLFLLTDKTCYQ